MIKAQALILKPFRTHRTVGWWHSELAGGRLTPEQQEELIERMVFDVEFQEQFVAKLIYRNDLTRDFRRRCTPGFGGRFFGAPEGGYPEE